MQIAPIFCPEPRWNHPSELAMLNRVQEHGEQLVHAYLAEETQAGVTYIARDKAKELFDEYRSDPTGMNRYADEAASAIADAARRTLLARPASRMRNRVLLITGCPASGKTVGVGAGKSSKLEIEHETILTSSARANQLIEEALQAERVPILRLVYTDDPRIHVRRMIDRASRYGRTVPISYMAARFVEVPRIVAKLEVTFGKRLAISVVNNSERPEQAVFHHSIARAVYHTSRYTEGEALEAMRAELIKVTRSSISIPQAILSEALL